MQKHSSVVHTLTHTHTRTNTHTHTHTYTHTQTHTHIHTHLFLRCEKAGDVGGGIAYDANSSDTKGPLGRV